MLNDQSNRGLIAPSLAPPLLTRSLLPPVEKPRRLQKAWRSLSMRALLRLLPVPDDLPNVADILSSGREVRVLYIRHDLKIGDLVMATGIMRAIANSSPNIKLDVLTSGQAAPVLFGNPHIRKLYVYRRKDWWTHPSLLLELRRANYDIVVDGRVNHIHRHATLPLFMIGTGCTVRIGAECGHPRLYSCTVTVPPGLHFVEQAACVVTPFGISVQETNFQPQIFLTDSELDLAETTWKSARARSHGNLGLLVNISAAASTRRWPDERFIEVIQRAQRHRANPAIIVISSPRDNEAARQIADSAGVTAVATPGLRDAIAFVATCDLLLTPDTGIAHIASAFRKPTIDLLLDQPIAPGPTMRKDAFVPYKTPGRNVYSPDMDITSLGIAPVIEALEQELDEFLIVR